MALDVNLFWEYIPKYCGSTRGLFVCVSQLRMEIMLSRHILYFVTIGSLFLLSFTIGAFAAEAPPEKSKKCATCHGANGISAGPLIPNLAGQKKDYLAKALNDFKSGNRNNPIMGQIVKDLNDTDIEELTTYFSGKKITVE